MLDDLKTQYFSSDIKDEYIDEFVKEKVYFSKLSPFHQKRIVLEYILLLSSFSNNKLSLKELDEDKGFVINDSEDLYLEDYCMAINYNSCLYVIYVEDYDEDIIVCLNYFNAANPTYKAGESLLSHVKNGYLDDNISKAEFQKKLLFLIDLYREIIDKKIIKMIF